MMSVLTSRRRFMQAGAWSAVSGIALHLAGTPLRHAGATTVIPAAGEAAANGLSSAAVPGWNPLWREAQQRIDGIAQVAGQKFYVRDIRASDMPGWPERQGHAFLLCATRADHVYEGLALAELGDLQPDVLVQAQDLIRDHIELPPFYGKEMFLAPGQTPMFIGHPVALLIYRDFERFRLAKRLGRSAPVLRYGEKRGWREPGHYGGVRYTRAGGASPYDDDVYSSLKDTVIFPASVNKGVAEWPPPSSASLQGEALDQLGMRHAADMERRWQNPLPEWETLAGQYYSQAIEAAALEPECTNGWYDTASATLHLAVGYQTPLEIAHDAATMLAHSLHKPRHVVIHPYTSTGYGAKENSTFNNYGLIAAVYAAVYADGLPVRLANDRFDQFQMAQKRHPFLMKNRMVADRKTGKLVQFQSEIETDGGGRPTCSWVVTAAGAAVAQSSYYLPASDTRAVALASRAVEAGSVRGYGKQQTMTATEMMMDEMAARLGLDPIEFRLRNVLRTGMKNMGGAVPAGSLRAEDVMRRAAVHPLWTGRQTAKAAFEREHPDKHYGVGFACTMKNYGTGAQGDFASVQMRADGQIHLRTSMVEIGTGSATGQAMMCRKWLGRAADTVKAAELQWPELGMQTHGNPYLMAQQELEDSARNPRWTPVLSSGSYASSASYFCSHEVLEATRLVFLHGIWPAALSLWSEGYGGGPIAPLSVRAQEAVWKDGQLLAGGLPPLDGARLAQRVHDLGGVTGASVHAYNGYQWAQADFVIDGERERLPLDGIALRHGEGDWQRLDRLNMRYPPVSLRRGGFFYYSAIGTLVALAIERPTGQVQVLSTHTIVDCGTPIVPELVRSQAEGGVAMGIGQALYESMPLYEGGPGEGDWNFHRYHLPRANEVAVWHSSVELLEPLAHGDPPKGIAEAVMIPVIPAVVNAVAHATGHHLKTLPLTPERIREVI